MRESESQFAGFLTISAVVAQRLTINATIVDLIFNSKNDFCFRFFVLSFSGNKSKARC